MKKMLSSLIFLAIIIIPIKVRAISGSINLNCTPASVFPGDAIYCTIAGDVSDGTINEYTATTTLSDNLEFISSSVSEDWSGTSNGGIFNLKSSKGQTGSFEIATFTVKLKNDATSGGEITLNTTKLGDVAQVGSVTKNISLSTSTNVTDTSDHNAEDTEEDMNTDIKNPQTGSNIPFMIIGGGIIAAIISYELASKKKKIHKI